MDVWVTSCVYYAQRSVVSAFCLEYIQGKRNLLHLSICVCKIHWSCSSARKQDIPKTSLLHLQCIARSEYKVSKDKNTALALITTTGKLGHYFLNWPSNQESVLQTKLNRENGSLNSLNLKSLTYLKSLPNLKLCPILWKKLHLRNNTCHPGEGIWQRHYQC